MGTGSELYLVLESIRDHHIWLHRHVINKAKKKTCISVNILEQNTKMYMYKKCSVRQAIFFLNSTQHKNLIFSVFPKMEIKL